MKKLKNRTKFTFFSMFNLIWFTIAVLALSYRDKTVPDVLITAWFAAWTIELGLLFGIKVKCKDE